MNSTVHKPKKRAAPNATTYKEFRYWLTENLSDGKKVYRIEFPGGHRTPPLVADSEASIKADIDYLIKNKT